MKFYLLLPALCTFLCKYVCIQFATHICGEYKLWSKKHRYSPALRVQNSHKVCMIDACCRVNWNIKNLVSEFRGSQNKQHTAINLNFSLTVIFFGFPYIQVLSSYCSLISVPPVAGLEWGFKLLLGRMIHLGKFL